MRIAILGAGAMGSLYAAQFALAGHEVWAIDRWAEHIEAIRRDGIRATGVIGERIGRPKATVDAHEAGQVDLVVISTKSADARGAAAIALDLAGKDGTILTIQNGLGAADDVAEMVGKDRLLWGVAGGFGAKMVAPGHVHHFGWQIIRLGEYAGGVTKRLERVAAAWRAAGFNVETSADLRPMIWEKLLCNVAFAGTCTLTGMTVGEVLANDDAWAISRNCALEAYAVAQAKGIAIEIGDPVEYVRRHSEEIPDARPSMLQDHMARRRSEIDYINGAIVRLGAESGVEVPVNATVVALVRAREALF